MNLPAPGYSENEGVRRSPAYLDHSELNTADTEAFETLLARYKQSSPSAARPADDNHLRHGGWDLIIVSRHTHADGQLASTAAVFRHSSNPAGPEEGSGPYVRMEFDPAGRALPTLRQEVPRGWSATSDLHAFASSVPGQLPGWTARVHQVSDQTRLREQVWDLDLLDAAFEQYVMHEVAVLTGPDHARLVAVPRPGARDQLLVGALHPPSLPTDLLYLDSTPPPTAIAVDLAPEQAVAHVRQRFLPHYEQAVRRARVQALRAAAEGIEQASDAWDAVSDSFCDSEGWPVDEEGYSDGKVARDAAAWEHVETFLDHGPGVLAEVRAAATGADYVEGPVSDDLRRLRALDDTLQRAGRIRHEWNEVMALMDISLPGSRALYTSRAQEVRNAEGWHYASELTVQGPALVRAAEYLADRTVAEQPAPTGRVQAALARSASSNPGAPAVPPPVPAPAPPRPPAPRRPR